MMALHLVPPRLSDVDSSNRDDSVGPCSDAFSVRTQSFTSRPPPSVLRRSEGQKLGREDDSIWLKPQDMAILKATAAVRGESCLANCQDQQHHCIKRLPVGAKPVKLVGEGAANAVFELKYPSRDRAGRDLQGFLLRVAKVPSLGAPLTYNYHLQQQYLQTAIRPILGEHVVHQELVMLHETNIVQELNNLLRDINHTRRDKFKGTYVGESEWGFLIEDMRPQALDTCILVEFKPKWLSQSPSAPKDAIRCRQCAMELRNLIKDLSINKTHPERKPCPLALLSPDGPRPVCSPFRMAPHLADDDADHDFYEKILRRIASSDAIRDLKKQQDIHDKVGPLHASRSDPFFPLAMTLRDCTCFAQIDKRSQSVRIRFGDFDWKDPLVKFERWAGVEAELVNGGFYTSEWFLCGDQFYRPPTLCLLEYGAAATSKEPEIIRIVDLKHDTDGGVGGQGHVQLPQCAIPKTVKIHDYSANAGVFQEILAPFRADAPSLTKHTERTVPQ
ncbi:hypothetical protein E4U57_005916 [Claviceps arundinis]|uniref:Inositol-pentakisphosphate 2-kinase n=1 Tax=Claviceps arundinis TaxID=1623583 RepID=A0ABQ7P2L6_9HYPO|nr:hypothetical protein E4U57_005916 [Claviceps arundinis]